MCRFFLGKVDSELDILYVQAVSLASVVLLSKICSAFRPDYGEKRRAVYSPGSSEEQTHKLITGCLPYPLITTLLMCFYF